MKNVAIFLFVAFLTSCAEYADLRSGSAQKVYQVDIRSQGFSLASVPQVNGVAGGFSECDETWEIDGPSGLKCLHLPKPGFCS